MSVFAALRRFLTNLFYGSGADDAGAKRSRGVVTDPEALRPSGPVLSLGPKASMVEATAHGHPYLLKKWTDLPPNARRELLRLIAQRQELSGAGFVGVLAAGEKTQDRQSGYVYCIQEHRPRTLKTWLSELGAQPPLEVAARVVREVAGSLREAHARSIVHGNLSPEAVYLSGGHGDDAGTAALDFIRYTGMDLAQNPAFTIAEVFPTGRSYLAPEALLGNPPDDLSDLYVLGIVAYETFTRQLPFAQDGASATQKIRGLLGAQVIPMSQRRSDVPNRWEVAIMKLLSKDRKLRFRSADDFLAAVEKEL